MRRISRFYGLYKKGAEQNAMNRLLETSLKTMDIDSARALAELKGKIDSGQLLQTQDWQSAENEQYVRI